MDGAVINNKGVNNYLAAHITAGRTKEAEVGMWGIMGESVKVSLFIASYSAIKNLATDVKNYTATFYSYDIHGNVKSLLQEYDDIPEMAGGNLRKRIDYDYDLISGKVNAVYYQHGANDAFYHRYDYDAENRLRNVEASRDQIVWERDASYQYYKHGPLASTVYGELNVQGMDNVYTLQGWLKGVNSTNLDPAADIGGDGGNGSVVAKDALGFALHYYDGLDQGNPVQDYKPVSGSSPYAKVDANSGFISLFNGNIGAMTVNNGGLSKGPAASTNALPLFYKK